jgi:cyclopropane fatty-acyl-phospholipid synthase-like methyltransferase
VRGARAGEGGGLTGDPGTDQRCLREEAYPDSTNLNARASIYAFKTPQLDFWDWALDHATWESGQRVLDIGCGPGTYLKRLDERTPGIVRVGADLSEGMAREAATGGIAGVVANVQSVPLAIDSVDRVLAMHML